MSTSPVQLDHIISLCKRRGFVFQTAEIYGGLNGVYDMGPLGTLLKQNIRSLWQKSLIKHGFDISFIEGSLLSPEAVWNASGHTQNFQDPLVDCTTCKKRFRADDIDLEKSCPSCGNKTWTDIRRFNLMFKTNLGAQEDSTTRAYLRPETAQSIFVNFKHITSSSRVKIPFGIAQIGKAFRNEITPKQFLFRMREFEQMELEWFCTQEDALYYFDLWRTARRSFYDDIGIDSSRLRVREHGEDEMCHYSTATSDIEYLYPFGWKELEGVAYRGNFDLTAHSEHSGKDVSVYDQEKNISYIPHVVETSVGVDRLFLTILFDAYTHEDLSTETKKDSRIVLKMHPLLSPYKAAFLPLSKKQSEKMRHIYRTMVQKGYSIQFDESGSIGKRYRRQDEIGTPLCFTYDFESDEDGCVTVRHRDTMQQERISICRIESYIDEILT
jgi:glycyl-tRNA synthetase